LPPIFPRPALKKIYVFQKRTSFAVCLPQIFLRAAFQAKKKLNININFIFLKLIFLGGLVARESAAKKSKKNISFIFLKLIFLGGLVAGKLAAKHTEKI